MKAPKANLFRFKWLWTVLFIPFAVGCTTILAQNRNQPKVHYEVHKKVDKNGHVTEYDSTYSYNYSNADTTFNGSAMNPDSLFNAMTRRMGIQMSPGGMGIFGNDPFAGMSNMGGGDFGQMDSLMQQFMNGNGMPGINMQMPFPSQMMPGMRAAPQDSLIPMPSNPNKYPQENPPGAKPHQESYRTI